MRSASTDSSLQNTLHWALDRMKQKGYEIESKVTLDVEPDLAIMGYARKEGGVHKIMISEWALDSEMLGGLVLHELSHVYFMERGASSHDNSLLERVFEDLREHEGLRAKEEEHLVDAFNHLQNVLVDDIVFDVMGEKEQGKIKRFFAEWISDRPSGDPVADASLLCRNAFAVASLKRRRLADWSTRGGHDDAEMYIRNRSLLNALGHNAEKDFNWLEEFLEKSEPDLGKAAFRSSLEAYFDRMISLMRSTSRLDDLR